MTKLSSNNVPMPFGLEKDSRNAKPAMVLVAPGRSEAAAAASDSLWGFNHRLLRELLTV